MDFLFLIGKPLSYCENYLKENNILYDIKIHNGKKMGVCDAKLVINCRYNGKCGRLLLYVSDFLTDVDNADKKA